MELLQKVVEQAEVKIEDLNKLETGLKSLAEESVKHMLDAISMQGRLTSYNVQELIEVRDKSATFLKGLNIDISNKQDIFKKINEIIFFDHM
ncbi:hypothetical protein IQ230_20850 [Gloeocapsopsis crepidinum LEGE 06123]|uniref:Uncharacterized protein n=1 Tax=Gloeocapsopsis crepidinum LEGE 06123 TaxID=588587 RepID=A0ABR9UWU9_9CHRO|nr:hypothetical protein [Gloeocapsopsis crepidinum]MBE9192756.1 hypothetical protein [Gloeocapsopsis crepidinum LEGE 06123]